MPVILPYGLPGRRTLRRERFDVTTEPAAMTAAGRAPLRVAVLNLMPNKPATEAQIARVLANAPAPVRLTFFTPRSYRPTHTPEAHLQAFYTPWDAVRAQRFDGLIVTGAPVETLPFEAVTYWRDLCAIFDWAQRHVRSTLCICWAAQAALYHFHGVPKRALPEKAFGVFRQRVVAPDAPLLRGFADEFVVPVSRHTEVRQADLPHGVGLQVLADSPESGLCLVQDSVRGIICMFNHLEYDAGTLRAEFLRDRGSGVAVRLPQNYFPDDDPERPPVNRWRDEALRFFGNWIDDLARRSPGRRRGERDVGWILQRILPAVSPARNRCADLLVRTDERPDSLPVLLRALKEVGLSDRGLRSYRRDREGLVFEVGVDPVDGRSVDARLRKLVQRDGIQSAGYRAADGSCALLLVSPRAKTAEATAAAHELRPAVA